MTHAESLEILYQDEHIIAINKPTGWFVHRSFLDREVTTIILQTLRDQIGQYLYPVHRLDRPTSGVLIFALTEESARHLSTQFMNNTVNKIYHAVVRGYVENGGTINRPLMYEIDKVAEPLMKATNEPQEAITYYRGLNRVEIPLAVGRYNSARYSLVELKPETGRKHQLRRHMNHIAHPIIGDTSHGDLRHNHAIKEHFHCQRLMLHASYLTIFHPFSNQLLKIRAPWDEEWKSLFIKFGWSIDLPSIQE